MLQTRHSPIIVGDRYELAEAFSHAGDNNSGLLAKSDYQTALLSMSDYNKHVTSEMNDYDSGRSSHNYGHLVDYRTSQTPDCSYYGYTQTGFSESQATISSANFGTVPNQALHDSQSGFETRVTYDTTTSHLTESSMPGALMVESFSPARGNAGTQLNIFIRSEYDLLAEPILVFTVLFGTHRVSASLVRFETSGPYYGFVASAIAPDMSETSANNSTLQLQLQIHEQSGQDAGIVEVGGFEYISNVLGSSPTAHEGSRKRKLSRTSLSSIQNIEDLSFAPNPGFVSTQNTHVFDTSSIPRRYAPYGRAQSKFRDITSRSGTQDLSIGSAARPILRQPNSSSSVFSPSYSFVSATGKSDSTDSSSVLSAPLIRTSTLQMSPGASPAGSAFNPYPLYGQRAVLKLKGNLNSMANNWTPEEWTAKRRLVQFFRSRDGCTVNARFAPVKPEDRLPNSITISCIWWEERQECFATSVDTIALLEQLVDNRFTVEEKNRIRRNLEGFKPLTVAKGKADSEEFFKVIMGFPNPKPRNIEKDVKVFEWKILAGALKKIISKYSASQSTTTGTLSSSHSSLFTAYQSDPLTDLAHAQMSSRSASISTASSNSHAQTLTSNLPSPNDALPSQYSDAVTGKSLHTLPHTYISPSLPSTSHFQPFLNNNQQQQQQNPHLPSSTSSTFPLERSHSYQHLPPSTTTTTPPTPRYLKRPRANTSSLHHHHSQSVQPPTPFTYHEHHHQVSRSFSEQPSSLPHHHTHHHHNRSGSFSQQLPPLSEEYAQPQPPPLPISAAASSSGTPTPTTLLHQPQPVRGGSAAVLTTEAEVGY